MKKNSIKDWTKEDQPRARLLSYGADQLSNIELLAILINTGSKGYSAMDLARNLFAYAQNDWHRLAKMDPEEMANNVKGIGLAKAVYICAALEISRRRNLDEAITENVSFNNAKISYDYLVAKLGDLNEEVVYVLFLNNKLKLIHELQLSKGTMTASLVDIRILLKNALQVKATNFILAHNHPSGDATPSQADEQLTKRVKEAAALMEIRLVDHIIIAQKSFYSFAEEGKI